MGNTLFINFRSFVNFSMDKYICWFVELSGNSTEKTIVDLVELCNVF